MDVLNPGDKFGFRQIQLPGGRWGAALAFIQNPKQKTDRGMIVACPKAARKFAIALLCYADEEEGIERKSITIKKPLT